MISNNLWIILLIVQFAIVTPKPTQIKGNDSLIRYNYDAQNKPKDQQNDEQVISVRITSSVAVGRSRSRNPYSNNNDNNQFITAPPLNFNTDTENKRAYRDDIQIIPTEIPPNLVGANIEFIKQLNAKKETKKQHNLEQVHPFQQSVQNQFYGETDHLFERTKSIEVDKIDVNGEKNLSPDFQLPLLQHNQSGVSLTEFPLKSYKSDDKSDKHPLDMTVPSLHSIAHALPEGTLIPTENQKYSNNYDSSNVTLDSVAESSVKEILTIPNKNDEEDEENIENVPLARSVPLSPSSQNYIQRLTSKTTSDRENSPSLTTVSFNIVHDTPEQLNNYNNEPINIYTHSNHNFEASGNKFYEPPKVYSHPAKIYSEPAKFYSEPAKIYSEPAKIYSEPAQIYSEPAKIYSEPAKFYSEPASLHLTPDSIPKHPPWPSTVQSTSLTNTPWIPSQNSDVITTINTTPTTINTVTDVIMNTQQTSEQLPEKNYEVDEKISVMTDGRSHGIQETTTEKCKQDNCKVGYVVEGRQYKKYRVEERTPDGFIVGEYGVVRNEDGALRGVRYTADSDASPRLIYDALMKFLQLK